MWSSRFCKPLLIIAPLFGLFSFAMAEDYSLMSLEELMDIEVGIATKTALTPRESPNTVAVVTRNEIINSGARDLLEVLTLLVPGMHFGADVEGAVGIGVRGLWAHEGKVLLMIDGLEANEEQFATTQFGNHYPIEVIDKIEIIRGPGSSIYGGYAGVGVINIVTLGSRLEGGFASDSYSHTGRTSIGRAVAYGFGHEGENYHYSLTGVVSEGSRSDRDNVDMNGESLSMEESSELNVNNLNMNLNYRGLDVRAIMDLYRTTQIDLWGENYLNSPLEESFDSYLIGVKYDFNNVGGKSLIITPEWKYKKQHPWNVRVPDEEYTNDKRVEKMQVALSGVWDVNKRSDLVFGVEGYISELIMPDNPGPFEETFKGGDRKLTYKNFASYLQWRVLTEHVNSTIGGRFDNSDEYGSSFVPRIGFAKSWEMIHGKLMFSRSFRIPGGIIPNRIPADLSGVTPEEANHYEIEIGYRFAEEMIVTVNGFDMKFDDVIVFKADPVSGVGSYYNSGELGSRGVEAEYRYQGMRAQALLNYAYYRATSSTVDIYEVPQDDRAFLAIPQHRLNLLIGCEIVKNVTLHPSMSFYGRRYGFAFDPSLGGASVQPFEEEALFNVNVRVRDILADGVEVDLGVRNISDEDFDYIQPYDGGHAPLPSQSRSYDIRVSYRF